jgi:hypothetical protein
VVIDLERFMMAQRALAVWVALLKTIPWQADALLICVNKSRQPLATVIASGSPPR